MSTDTDNHDQEKPSVSKQQTARNELSGGDDETSVFDGRRIKKERTDVSLENGAGGVYDNNKQLQRTGRFSTNGFHDGDLLQDIIAAKFTALTNHTTTGKHDKIRLMIEDTISEESKGRVQEIFSQIERLKVEEKLLLYLKFPSLLTNSGGTVDPLRQPLNPLGNRYEIHQTIMWIKTHLEEDPDVSLPKQEVYDEYNMYCMRNSMKPLSTADFGKVMKQVYPRVRPRRLGTRGNSRYCYAGMRKRVKLDPPTLPNISGTHTAGNNVDENVTEEMLGAASTLIREWAETVLGMKFSSLSTLARHLVDNLCVDTRSLAAVCILCSLSGGTDTSKSQGSSVITPLTGKPAGKLREAQLQLQRKLQQRNQDPVLQSKDKTSSVENKTGLNCKPSKKAKCNHQVASSGQNSYFLTNSRQKKVVKSSGQQQQQQQSTNNSAESSNCDNIVVQSIEDNNPTRIVSGSGNGNCANTHRDLIKQKNCRKRANSIVPNNNHHQSDTSPEKQTKLAEEQLQEDESSNLPVQQRSGKKISVMLATSKTSNPRKDEVVQNCDIESRKSRTNGNFDLAQSSALAVDGGGGGGSAVLTKEQIRLLQIENRNLLTNSRVTEDKQLCSIDSDALDDYLNGGNNSQEQEEELLQYFQQSSSSSSSSSEKNTEQISRSDKVSQLRLILQQNLKAGTIQNTVNLIPTAVLRRNVVTAEKISDVTRKHNLILPTLLNQNITNTRRRVSFETNVVEHVQDATTAVTNTVPQSPNTRRRIFNFTPISPGPHSPINGGAGGGGGGRASKSNSANASPFVSPRNTPVPRSRSNLQSAGAIGIGNSIGSGGTSRTRGHKSLSRSISCSMPYTGVGKIDTTFVVPTTISVPETVRQQSAFISNKSTEVQDKNSSLLIAKRGSSPPPPPQPAQCAAAFLSSDLTTQNQLLINYPSQENLQEIKNVYQKGQPTDQEISELFHDNKQFSTEQFYRSQSVPLHRMVNPALMSPISNQQHQQQQQQHCCSFSTFQTHSQSFNPSTSSSVAPTPVPSEFNDFGSSIGHQPETGSSYLLDDVVDTNFISGDQHFLISEKEITPENITNILDILDVQGAEGLQQILPDQTGGQQDLNNGPIAVLDDGCLQNSNLDISEEDIDSIPLEKIIIQSSRSYPNTPLPAASVLSTYTPSSYTEDSNGSRSYPSTPLQTREPAYQEPMLSSPTLNSLNLHSESASEAVNNASPLCRNVADLLDANFLGDTDAETDDLDPLANFDGLQDVDSLTPLFNEVTEPNH